MFIGAENSVHVYYELIDQLNQISDNEYFLLCNTMVDCQKISLETNSGRNITYIQLGKYSKPDYYSRNDWTENKRGVISKAKFWIKGLGNYNVLKILANKCDIKRKIQRIKEQEKKIIALLYEHKPDMVMVDSGYRAGYELALLKQARLLEIPVFLIPFTKFISPEEMLSMGFKLVKYTRDKKQDYRIKKIKQNYPNQVYTTGEYDLLRYPINDIISMARREVLPFNPWFVGGNQFTEAFTSDDTDYRASKNSLPKRYSDKITKVRAIEKTGLLNYLNDRNNKRNELNIRYGIGDGSIAVLATEAFAESSYPISYDDSIAVYTYVRDLLLDEYDYVIIALHPRMSKSKYEVLSIDGKCFIAKERLYKIASLCDVFVGYTPFLTAEMVADICMPTIMLNLDDMYRIINDGDISIIQEKIHHSKEDVNSEIKYIGKNEVNFSNYFFDKYLVSRNS